MSDLSKAIQRTPVPEFEHTASPAEVDFARGLSLTHDMLASYSAAFDTSGLTKTQIRTRAGYLLATERVAERYHYFQQLLANRMDIREERILAELAAIAFSDPLDYLTESGHLKPLSTIPAHARAAISEFETGFTKDGQYSKAKLQPKMQALTQLIAIKNMAKDSLQAKAPKIVVSLDSSPTTTNTHTNGHHDADK